MILFVFEGERREPLLFKTLGNLFFSTNEEHVVCSFGNNIYELYKQLSEMDDVGDIVSILREKLQNKNDNPLKGFSKTSDFSEIYMFFDYDFHNHNLDLSEINSQLGEMLTFFDNETDNGKLYINYPMVESIRYTKELLDLNYWEYTVTRDECRNFKNLVQEFSFYKNFGFIQLKNNTEEDRNRVIQNWQYLKEQNASKANYICNGDNSSPQNKESIAQQKIFESQLEKYVNSDCRVAILNAFPLFLYEYFKQDIVCSTNLQNSVIPTPSSGLTITA